MNIIDQFNISGVIFPDDIIDLRLIK